MTETTKDNQALTFPATVAAVLNAHRVVINRGSEHGIKLSQRFLIYSQSNQQIIDPTTQEILGYLETYKGTGKVVHIQEKMSVVESDREFGSKPGVTNLNLLLIGPTKPFDNPTIGDKAKPV